MKPNDPHQAEVCEWYEDGEEGFWHGVCGVYWMFPEDGPVENGCNFCPRCGGRLSIADATLKAAGVEEQPK